MIVTREWIHGHKTRRGAWNKKQLAVFGVKWPPVQGWISRLEGTRITDQQRREFESLSAASPQLLPLGE